MKYPENERILIVRPCLKTICAGIRPAAKLLSLLLYKARNCSDKVPTYTFSCTQQDLVDDLIEEMDVKTLHRTAIPFLRLLGYLDVDGSSYRYTYTVHLDRIQHALTLISNSKQLEKCLIVWIGKQGEKFPEQIDFCPIQLDICPIQLDKLLIPFRQMSNSKRGRKTRLQEPLEVSFEDNRLREIEEIERYDSSPSPSEQHTDAFLIPTLPLRDDMSVHKSSYSHEPAAPSPDKSEWLWENEGETDIFEEDADPTEKRPVVSQGGNLAPEERRALLESEDRREGSNEHPAIKPTGSRQPPASPGQAAHMREQPTTQSTADEKPRQPTRTPESEAGTPPLPDKTMEKGNRKKDAALLCETSKIRKLIDATRGHALEDPGALINQSKIIHAWCEKHPIEHATLVLHHIMTGTCKKHAWWRAHLDAFSAKALAQLTSEILPELGIIPKPELPPDMPMPVTSSPPNGKYHPYTRASMYEPIEIGV